MPGDRAAWRTGGPAVRGRPAGVRAGGQGAAGAGLAARGHRGWAGGRSWLSPVTARVCGRTLRQCGEVACRGRPSSRLGGHLLQLVAASRSVGTGGTCRRSSFLPPDGSLGSRHDDGGVQPGTSPVSASHNPRGSQHGTGQLGQLAAGDSWPQGGRTHCTPAQGPLTLGGPRGQASRHARLLQSSRPE